MLLWNCVIVLYLYTTDAFTYLYLPFVSDPYIRQIISIFLDLKWIIITKQQHNCRYQCIFFFSMYSIDLSNVIDVYKVRCGNKLCELQILNSTTTTIREYCPECGCDNTYIIYRNCCPYLGFSFSQITFIRQNADSVTEMLMVQFAILNQWKISSNGN